jgi:hypothetical protein
METGSGADIADCGGVAVGDAASSGSGVAGNAVSGSGVAGLGGLQLNTIPVMLEE